MFKIIDYRNGRYQGQTQQGEPHGIGVFMDRNLMFCVCEWERGQIAGNAMIIYESGRIFCGAIYGRRQVGLCSYELVEDHIKLIRYLKENKYDGEPMAAVLPLHKLIFEIQNSNKEKAYVKQEYQYSYNSEQDNYNTVGKILNIDSRSQDFYSHRDCVQFFIDKFYNNYPNHFEYYCREIKSKKQYFMGLKDEGLGLTIQPIEQLKGFVKKQSGQVYKIRSMGTFTRDNQLKELGVKMVDNVMKGFIYEEGVFARPETIIRYQMHRRPENCKLRVVNELKQSMFYRDTVLETQYIQSKELFIGDFDAGLRTIRTEEIAQRILQIPNNRESVVREIQERRLEQQRRREQERSRQGEQASKLLGEAELEGTMGVLTRAQIDLDLQKVKDDIYRSVNKKKGVPYKINMKEYNDVRYVDPNYKEKVNLTLDYTRENKPQLKTNVSSYEIKDYEKQERSNPKYRNRRLNGSISPPAPENRPDNRYTYLPQERMEPEYSRYSRNTPDKDKRRVTFTEKPLELKPSRRIYQDASPARRVSPRPYPQTEPRKDYKYMFEGEIREEPKQYYAKDRPKPRRDYQNYSDPLEPIVPGFSPSRYNKKHILSRQERL